MATKETVNDTGLIEINGIAYEVTNSDTVLFNGSCYTLSSDSICSNFRRFALRLDKDLAEQLIESGSLLFDSREKSVFDLAVEKYRFDVEKLNDIKLNS